MWSQGCKSIDFLREAKGFSWRCVNRSVGRRRQPGIERENSLKLSLRPFSVAAYLSCLAQIHLALAGFVAWSRGGMIVKFACINSLNNIKRSMLDISPINTILSLINTAYASEASLKLCLERTFNSEKAITVAKEIIMKVWNLNLCPQRKKLMTSESKSSWYQ